MLGLNFSLDTWNNPMFGLCFSCSSWFIESTQTWDSLGPTNSMLSGPSHFPIYCSYYIGKWFYLFQVAQFWYLSADFQWNVVVSVFDHLKLALHYKSGIVGLVICSSYGHDDCFHYWLFMLCSVAIFALVFLRLSYVSLSVCLIS